MRTLVNAAQMKAIDTYMTEQMHIPGIILMENAARAVSDTIIARVEPCFVRVFCGCGNNGGDGFAVARQLRASGYEVEVVLLGDAASLQGDAKVNFAFWQSEYFHLTHADLLEDLEEADVVVDAIFGTGLTREVQGLYAAAIEHINAQNALIVSVDVPSGVSADTGKMLGCAVDADVTVTFQYAKVGHFLFPGREYAGELIVAPIGVDDGCDVALQSTVCGYETPDPDLALPCRKRDSNKGDYGKLLMVAGSAGMAGAAVLCAQSAGKSGVGLVSVAAPEPVVAALQQCAPQATCHILPGASPDVAPCDLLPLLQDKTAVAVGPGIGLHPNTPMLIRALIQHCTTPMILDADALNAVAQDVSMLQNKQNDLVLTPHPKEFARLLGVETKSILENPLELAAQFAVLHRVVLVLKGATTVIADEFGNITLACTGSPGMAKGGSGDVLTGMIGGLLAQGKDAYEAALLGVCIAGRAGELAEESVGLIGMTPLDTIAHLAAAIEELRFEFYET